MPEHFDWQTDDENDWPGQPTNIQRRRKRGRWRWLSLIIIALIVGVVVFWRARIAVQEAEEKHIEDVLSSQGLVENAVERSDTELFRTLLSGSDSSWAKAQQMLFANGWLGDLSAWGLGQKPVSSVVIGVELAPDLDEAVVTLVHRYSAAVSGPDAAIIELQEDRVFRRGARWLWSPPRAQFWGGDELAEIRTDYLMVAFPERDRPIIEPFVNDLDRMIKQMCLTSEIDCPADLKVQINFETHPESLIRFMNHTIDDGIYGTLLPAGGENFRINLPTPTLIGKPLDPSGYDTLARGYQAYIIGGLLSRHMDMACCLTEEIFRSTIRTRLAELDAIPERSIAQADKPIDPGLHLICLDDQSWAMDLYRMNPLEGSWQLLAQYEGLVNGYGSVGDSGLILFQKIPQAERVNIRLVRLVEDDEQILFERDLSFEAAALARTELREREEKLVLEIPRPDQGYSSYISFDLTRCDLAGCPIEFHDMIGRPVWSPDGEQLLIREYGRLWLREGYQNLPLGDGYAPFWVDEDTYGFLRTLGGEQFIILEDYSYPGSNDVVPGQTILASLDPLERPRDLGIGLVWPDMLDPDFWFILGFDVDRRGRASEALILGYDRQTQASQILIRSNHLNSLLFPPKGGGVATSYYDEIENHWAIRIYDHTVDKSETYPLPGSRYVDGPPVYRWSPDGRHIAMLQEGQLNLVEVGSGRLQPFQTPTAGCFQPFWSE